MLEVHSWKDESTGETKLLFVDFGEGRTRTVFNLYTGQAIQLHPGQKVPPEFMLKIPWDMAPEFENALAQWLAKKGVRNDHDAKLEGTLEATRYHLEDLREMLKLRTPPVTLPREREMP